MQTKRAFVFPGLRSQRALAVLECISLTAREAKIPANVNLGSIKPGMIVRPALAPRKADMQVAYTIQDVQQSKTGQSTIRFQSEVPEPKALPVKEKGADK